MLRIVTLGLTAVVVAVLSACTPDYSPNTYSGNAVQHANKVERAIVVGYREIAISANGTLGAVEGGAAGGILGSQSGDIGLNAALGAVGGTVIGGLVGTTLEHVTADTTGWEYIVRKENGDLLSVTQREPTPLPIGQRVLVITGNQARIIADYSVPLPLPPKAAAKASTDAKDGKEATAAKEPAAAKTAESKPPRTPRRRRARRMPPRRSRLQRRRWRHRAPQRPSRRRRPPHPPLRPQRPPLRPQRRRRRWWRRARRRVSRRPRRRPGRSRPWRQRPPRRRPQRRRASRSPLLLRRPLPLRAPASTTRPRRIRAANSSEAASDPREALRSVRDAGARRRGSRGDRPHARRRRGGPRALA